jgi:hypothetical protein
MLRQLLYQFAETSSQQIDLPGVFPFPMISGTWMKISGSVVFVTGGSRRLGLVFAKIALAPKA